MKQKTLFLSFLLLLLTSVLSLAAEQQAITINVPDSVVKEVIAKSLPAHFEIQSKTLLGGISIDKIENLQLLENKVSGHITLSGHELQIVTTIAGHNLRMKIGSLTMGFQCDATLRFDSTTATLYIKPVITEIQSSDQQKTDVASTVAMLFNNQEFPLQLETLSSITADAGNKIITIALAANDISVKPNCLSMQILPNIVATAK